jgi:tetratricopeptide (TPR) repeat protein
MNILATKLHKFSYALLLACTVSCASREASIEQDAFAIPQLKARVATLSPVEFATYQKKYDELTRTIIQKPSEPAAYIEMAQLFMNEARISGDHPHYYPAARKLLDRALTLDPDNFNALISLGSIQLSLHQFEEASATGRKAASIAPHSNFPWGIICDASIELGDHKAAVMAADTMVAIRPDLRSYARVSYVREVHGDINGAIEAMKMAVGAGVPGREEKAWARNTLGNMYLNRGDLKRAEMELLIALQERPNYAFALGSLAKVRAAEKNYSEAIKLLDSASALVPEFSFAQLKADILNIQGQRQAEAMIITDIEEGLAEDEASGHAMDREFAMLYATRGIKQAKAEEYARKEFAKRPKNHDAKATLAIACLRSGKLEEARKLINSVVEEHPNHGEYLAYAGLIAHASGERALAKQQMSRAIELAPFLTPLLLNEVNSKLAAL